MKTPLLFLVYFGALLSCSAQKKWVATAYETSESGKHLQKIEPTNSTENICTIEIFPNETYQTITGFGGSFTEATAHLLTKMSEKSREKILKLYFSEEGANYSLTRTTIGSSDFSLKSYAYTTANDEPLSTFSINEDMDDIIPIIKQAQGISKEGFKIIATPWSAPPFMKDNASYLGGKLVPNYQTAFANYIVKYLTEYQKQGINIWGITPINEPLGNNNNWESMHFSPKELTDFVEFQLGPILEKSAFRGVKLLGYDQNRGDLKQWVDEMYRNKNASKYFAGTAVHWYDSTYHVFEDELQYAHQVQPTKHLIQTEACIDGQLPVWKNDDWYWQKNAKDWGYKWAEPNKKYLHPQYAPVHRYANDLIGSLNNYVDGWIDWNMVLDKNGGPNWAKNWCVAPILVDVARDEAYLTPLYFVMMHFSKFIRPEAQRIGWKSGDKDMKITAVRNKDQSVVVVVFNPTETKKNFEIVLENSKYGYQIDKNALQSILIK